MKSEIKWVLQSLKGIVHLNPNPANAFCGLEPIEQNLPYTCSNSPVNHSNTRQSLASVMPCMPNRTDSALI